MNSITTPDKYSPPFIQSLFLNIHGKKIFSTVDLERAYNQIPVSPESIQKTAIATPWGLYKYIGMPFGLKNATQTFQRYIDYIFRGLDFVFIYIDDIMVMSENEEQHRHHLEQVFQRLADNKLSINTNKCTFGQRQVTFLGYQISGEGFHPNPERVRAIEEYSLPTTVMELRKFLGMFNYYRPCVKNAAELQLPLTAFLKNSKKKDKTLIVWTDNSKASFLACKKALSSVALTTYPAPNVPLRLTTDDRRLNERNQIHFRTARRQKVETNWLLLQKTYSNRNTIQHL